MKEEKMYPSEEIRTFFGVSRQALHLWHNEGRLKKYKVGRRVYYKKSDVERIIPKI